MYNMYEYLNDVFNICAIFHNYIGLLWCMVMLYLFMANINQAITESLYFKLNQIEDNEYTWLSEEDIDTCMQQYKNIIGSDCQNECPLIEEYIIHSGDDIGHQNIDKFTKQNKTIFCWTDFIDYAAYRENEKSNNELFTHSTLTIMTPSQNNKYFLQIISFQDCYSSLN